MTLQQKLKELSLRDWIWIIGAGCAVIGTWFTLQGDVKALNEAKAAQIVRDDKQDEALKEVKKEIKEVKQEIKDDLVSIKDEIKQEIRDLRKEIHRR